MAQPVELLRFVRVPTGPDQFLLVTRLRVRGQEEWFALHGAPDGGDPYLAHYPYKLVAASDWFAYAQEELALAAADGAEVANADHAAH